jgi:hypothetical protein
MKQGMGYLSSVSKVVSENAKYSAGIAYQKGQEYGINDSLATAQQNVISAASSAGKYTQDGLKNAQQSANDGTLMTKTTEATYKAASMFSSVGYSLFNRVKEYQPSNPLYPAASA